ncbi:Peptidase family M23 [Cyclonatronum proteinivorum]|uniref:Peptidase family M23 n=1 Tax=Cyclonatronum proteinivorum TaxID=1457365 RepID=A0A345UJ11_9BACT|nr:M23 family metallopeptidase [Cyclonatronum proteinivorum]AXJ00463.1 Peptidase family M23 [Cyclonatronum proteinivorum]
MLEFLSRITSFSNEKLTVLLWQGQAHETNKPYTIVPRKMLGLLVVTHLIVIALMFLFFFLTPLGTLLFNREDQAVREQIVEIRDRIEVLRDSLHANEIQLSNFKLALMQSADTTFTTGISAEDRPEIFSVAPAFMEFDDTDFFTQVRGLSVEEIVHSAEDFFSSDWELPLRFPLEGTVTRGFDLQTGHTGIDIAAAEGTVIRTFADGVVLFSGFTIQYGNVMVIQHINGFLSIYKHCKSLARQKGDFVKRGDIIGRVGSTGILTSGPHLHFELWQNGVALDPSESFTNLN